VSKIEAPGGWLSACRGFEVKFKGAGIQAKSLGDVSGLGKNAGFIG
jgi:hypothetical protein